MQSLSWVERKKKQVIRASGYLNTLASSISEYGYAKFFHQVSYPIDFCVVRES